MGFFKKIIYGVIASAFILMGGFGAQSNSMMMQIGGIVGLVIGLIVLYIFVKMAWRAMGLIPSLLVFTIIILFVLYAIGAFSDGIGNVSDNIQSFLGQGTSASSEQVVDASFKPRTLKDEMVEMEEKAVEEARKKALEEDKGVINLIGADEHPIITENFMPKPAKKEKNAFNPLDFPAIEGVSKVVKGDVLTLSGRVVKLYGVAAPDISQTCADATGRGYRCGQQSIAWLSSWLVNNQIRCHILGENKDTTLTGVCMLGPYDIGAALVNAGWAVADTRQSKIYVAYQNQAAKNRRGLWQGKFYMPWDWKKIKERKANIKIIKPKSSRKSVWSKFF